MSAVTARRMSRVDTAWLRMDNDVNRMMIVGVWMLKPSITLAAFRQRVSERLLKYPRFRQKAVLDLAGASWVDDADFDVRRHVVAERLSADRGPAARAALQARCGELAMQPLRPDRPLWQFHLVARHDGGSAAILRVHHSIGDGIALISVLNSITDGGVDPPTDTRADSDPDGDPDADWLRDAVLAPFTALAVKALDWSGSAAAKAIDGMASARMPLGDSVQLARRGLDLLGDAAALALMGDDATTRLKGRPAGIKRVAWSEPMPLEQIRTVGKALGCSINDVLLASVSGAIGRWLREQGDDPSGQEIRAMVPVNLRPLEEAWKLGNRFGLAPLVLPIGMDNPAERVFAVRARMAALKGSFQPLLAFAVLAMSGMLAKPLQDAILDLFAKKTTAVMTNVPGPREALKFCGSTLEQTMFWVPASGDVAVGVSILSYAGGVQFGLITDAAVCDDPQQIVDAFEPEFDRLLWLALMLPWPGEA